VRACRPIFAWSFVLDVYEGMGRSSCFGLKNRTTCRFIFWILELAIRLVGPTKEPTAEVARGSGPLSKLYHELLKCQVR
jgi:hypothetical protein